LGALPRQNTLSAECLGEANKNAFDCVVFYNFEHLNTTLISRIAL
jgi:hypothetical protein